MILDEGFGDFASKDSFRARSGTAKAICLAVVVFVTMALHADGEVIGNTEALRVVAKTHADNRDRIQTWQGKVKVTTNREAVGDRPTRTFSTVTFAYDRDQAATRWNRTYDERFEIVDGMEIPVATFGDVNGMLKRGRFYRRVPLSRGESGPATIRIFEPGDQPGEPGFGYGSDDFNPMYFLSDRGIPLDEHFNALFRNRDEEGVGTRTITRAGEIVIATFQAADSHEGQGVTYYHEVDLSQGGNIINLVGRWPGGEMEFTCEYQERGGVWVPSIFTHQYTKLREDKTQRKSTRVMRWVENRVNEPLPDDAFSLEALGARPGDRVIDTESGAEYTIQK